MGSGTKRHKLSRQRGRKALPATASRGWMQPTPPLPPPPAPPLPTPAPASAAAATVAATAATATAIAAAPHTDACSPHASTWHALEQYAMARHPAHSMVAEDPRRAHARQPGRQAAGTAPGPAHPPRPPSYTQGLATRSLFSST